MKAIIIEVKSELIPNNKDKGNMGEAIARTYLIRNGYEVITTNFRCQCGEIDIIAKKDDTIIFIEVKYRKNMDNGSPSEAVNFRKQNKIKKVALMYSQRNNLNNINFRFDIIEVLGVKNCSVNQIQNAFC